MNISIPRRWLMSSATCFLPQFQSQSCVLSILTTCTRTHLPLQHRSISFNPFKRREKLDPKTLDKLKTKVEASVSKQKRPELPTPGGLAPSSIFEQELPSESQAKDGTPSPINAYKSRNPAIMAAALNPRPLARRRWLRMMVIRNIRGRGRLNKSEKILRTERSLLAKSPFIKTSIKKLYPLARQIAGKPITEAMVQMRFSKKKAARDVLKHLELARNQAIVSRGMGLGNVGKETKEGEGEKETVVIEDKKGKKRVVKDLSDIYVDEAWVGRGIYELERTHRARGSGNNLRLPYTSISVVLKEEATRLRLQGEREAKRQKKKVWVPLPDRPITAQRQYPLW